MPILFDNSHWKVLRNPVYLETGLLKGSSLLKAYRTKLFKKLISIEISQKHIEDFVTKQHPVSKCIKLIHGNSKDLGKHIVGIKEPITFFLDAHDDQRFTKDRERLHDDPEIPCPILEELEAIANHPVQGHKILIDDMQCFRDGHQHDKHSWFEKISFHQIIDKVAELFPRYSMYLIDSYRKKDVLVCVPEETAIPKLIHMTYKDNKLPELFSECKKRAKQFYRDFDLIFHTDADMEEFMSQHYPEYKKRVFDQLPLKIMKLDLFRYCLLETYGGLYLDMDHEICRRHPFLKSDLFLCLNRDKRSGDARDMIGNSIIASKPGHLFWKLVREELESKLPRILDTFNKNKDRMITQCRDRKNFVIEATGPKFLTEVYEKHIGNLRNLNVRLVPRKVFHNPKPKNEKEYKDLVSKGVACGFHHCAGTWHRTRH